MVRSLLCIWTIDPLYISLHNWVFTLIYYDKLKTLLIFFYGVLSNIPRDLLTFFYMWSFETLVFLPPWSWMLPCLNSLTRFGSSRSTILSCRGIVITHVVSLLTTICWQMILVTSWGTKANCTYSRVLKILSNENIMIFVVISARYIHKIWSQNNLTRHRWPMTYVSTAKFAIHTIVLNLIPKR